MIVRRHSGEQCLLYQDCYGNNLEHILHLFRLAKKDFPGLKFADVCVITLAGQSNAGVTAIHWHGDRRGKLNVYDSVERFDI